MKKVLTAFFSMMFLFTFSFSINALASEEKVELAENIIESAKKYKGTSYQANVDCSYFVQTVFKEHGIELERSSADQYNQGASVEKAELQKGDLVFFNTSGSGISHVGIYIGNNKFIHNSTSKGVIESKLNDPYYWGSRYVGAAKVY